MSSGHLPVQMYSFTFAMNSIGKRFRKCTIMEGSKERLHVKFMQTQIVLNVWVLLDVPDSVFVA